MAFSQSPFVAVRIPRIGRTLKLKHFRKTGKWPVGPIFLRPEGLEGFGQYQAGDYATDMWKGSIYDQSPANTSINWLGTLSTLLTTASKVASNVVPAYYSYRTQREQQKTTAQIEQARLANEQMLAQAQARYYEQLAAQSKANAAAAQNQQVGSTIPYTPTVTTAASLPVPVYTSGGREPMYGTFAAEIIPEDLKKYLPYIGFGLLAVIILLRASGPAPVKGGKS